MNVQVEHLEKHLARITVLVDPAETTTAKQKAAKRLAKKVRLPGFRPGKAPYNVVVRMMGEDAILEEAMEDIGNDIYAKALEESKVEPAAPGSFEEFKEEEGQLKLVFTVPKLPEVDLKDYRSQRFDLEPEEVTDENVSKALESIQENLAVVEDVDRPAKVGDEVELDLTVTFWHDDA
ncbi:MAG: trigger factor, partial [Anaerolineae bacterium]|nr:trigger factor [Anaerolineae bacterium]